MDKDLEGLKVLVKSIESLTVTTLISMIVILLAVALFQAITKGYLKKKFQDIATNENFEELKKQLNDNTKIVEAVKANIQTDIWLSQQVWTKKQESYEQVIKTIFEIKALFKKRLNLNKQWLKDIVEDDTDSDLDNRYNSLINFTNSGSNLSIVDEFELLEEKIIAKSVFLILDFKAIENKLKTIRHDILSIEVLQEEVCAYETKIEKISDILELKITTLEEIVSDIHSISGKDLKIELP